MPTPRRPRKTASAPAHPVSLVVCARWETDHIAEWLVYHRAIGFDHVFLYCNDDDPAELYAAVLPFGDFVTFTWFPIVGQQVFMYRHFLEHHLHETAWFQFLDVDEFLFLGPHASISAYLATVPDEWDSVYFNWFGLGPDGHDTRPPGSVLLNYRRRAERPDAHTKTMTRAGRVTPAGVDPHSRDIIHNHWSDPGFGVRVKRNPLGDDMDDYWTDFPHRAYDHCARPHVAAAMAAGPCIFHYVLKSYDDFRRRARRSTIGEFRDQDRWGRMFKEGALQPILDQIEAIPDSRLAERWTAILAGWRHGAILPRPDHPDIAAGKEATQSSVSSSPEGRTAETDAPRALAGPPTGSWSFMTAEQDRPWWMVDLGGMHVLHEIRIYNRFEDPQSTDRFREFDLTSSDDGDAWVTLAEIRARIAVGGIDGRPFRFEVRPPLPARFVRVTLAGRGILHLDHVEVFGEPDITGAWA